ASAKEPPFSALTTALSAVVAADITGSMSNKGELALPPELASIVAPLGPLSWSLRAQAAAAFQENPAGVRLCVEEALRGERPRALFGVLLRQGLHRGTRSLRHEQPVRHRARPIDSCMACTKVRPLDDYGDLLLCDACRERECA